MQEHLFLYGTLLPGQAPAEVSGVMRQLRRIGKATMRGSIYDLGEYPGAILNTTSNNLISGEVFVIPHDPSVLKQLDEL